MEGVIEHVKNQYPNCWWSEIYYLSSSVVDGISIATLNHNTQGAKAIILRQVYWVPVNGGTTFQFNDQFGNIIFATKENKKKEKRR